jgi:ABC-type molybdate transport system substrate-binding protein
MIFCGAAFKRPMEEVAVQWKKKTGTEIFLNYASVPALSLWGRGKRRIKQ